MPSTPLSSARVIWFTGLSGAGKSTIASAVFEQLTRRGVPVEYLDGDVIRGLFPETGYTRPERDAHVKRVGFLASRLEHHGVTVICALISPYRDARNAVRRLCRRFVEVYVSTPLVECERRDPKGLYARARRHELANFTGIDDPYEPPEHPELTIDTTSLTVGEEVERVLALIAEPAPTGRIG
jgi:adenylylsulfate kinase